MTSAEIIFTIAMIFQINNSTVIGTATGFFCLNESNDLYLVTNRHVVEPEKGKPIQKIIIRVHKDSSDLTKIQDVEIPLIINGNKTYKWYKEGYDIVSIPLTERFFDTLVIKPLRKQNSPPDYMQFSYGSKLNVLGFPRGFTDTNTYIPILKTATVSTPPLQKFQNNPMFLMDGNLKKGMSGSPVFTEISSTFQGKDGNLSSTGEVPKFYFVGIYSGNYSTVIGQMAEPVYSISDGKIKVDDWKLVPVSEELELHTCYINSAVFRLLK